MPPIPQTTIEQWAVLRVVVEQGGFAQAAEILHRSQSSVSYAVARLQDRLGARLLEIDGRKARLTEKGRALLADAVPLIDDLARLEERCRSLSRGIEAGVRLHVDSIFPKPRLFAALTAFEAAYPHVQVELREIVRQTAPNPLVAPFDLAICVWSPGASEGLRLLDVELLAVARADHGLHRRRPTRAALLRHRRVAIQDDEANRSRVDFPQEPGLLWRVNTVEAAIDAVRSGLCYGWLPRHLIERELARRELLVLPLAAQSLRVIPLALTYADAERAGPATRALARLLIDGA